MDVQFNGSGSVSDHGEVDFLSRLLEQSGDGEFVNVDLIDALVSVFSYNEALSLRLVCKGFDHVIELQRYGHRTIGWRINYRCDTLWMHPNSATYRVQMDGILRNLTPYSTCWEAMIDPLFAVWICKRVDPVYLKTGLMSVEQFREEVKRSEYVRLVLEDVREQLSEQSIDNITRLWGRSGFYDRWAPTGWLQNPSVVFEWLNINIVNEMNRVEMALTVPGIR